MSHTIEQTRNKKPMWVFEKNYLYLREIFPELIDVSKGNLIFRDSLKTVNVRCLEVSRYTTLISLRLTFLQCPQIQPVNMSIRLYHDAELADVVSYQEITRLIAPYFSTNKNRHENHKRQANILLNELLSGCVNQHNAEKV